jgi:hypothetical protein
VLRKLSLTTQFALVFMIALGLVGAASWLILDRIYINQLKSQAETVADNVDAFGNWVAQYGRVWVRDNDKSYLGHLPLFQNEDTTGGAPKLTAVNFYSKNPALAQREFSEVVEHSASPAKFRLTSHNVMNPNNKPDPFEDGALRRIREGKLPEYFELTPTGFRYARAVHHKASCITCHGDPAAAPNDVKVRYGTQNGFGFKEGEVAGHHQRAPARALVLGRRAQRGRRVAAPHDPRRVRDRDGVHAFRRRAAPEAPDRCHAADLARQARRAERGQDRPAQPQRARPAGTRDRALAGVDQHGDPAPHQEEQLTVAARFALPALVALATLFPILAAAQDFPESTATTSTGRACAARQGRDVAAHAGCDGHAHARSREGDQGRRRVRPRSRRRPHSDCRRQQFGASAVGIEYDPELAALARRNAERAGVPDTAKIVTGDIFKEISRRQPW